MVLFGGLVLILTHAKVITLLIEDSIEGLQLICSGSGPERRGIILWFEHRGRSSSCTPWIWYWLHLSLPLKLGVFWNLSYRSLVRLSCFMFLFQDTSKVYIPKWIATTFKIKKKIKDKYNSLATSAAVPMAPSAIAAKAQVLGQPVWLLWRGSPAFMRCVSQFGIIAPPHFPWVFLVAQMLFPFYIYSIHVLGFCLRALELLDGQAKLGAATAWGSVGQYWTLWSWNGCCSFYRA